MKPYNCVWIISIGLEHLSPYNYVQIICFGWEYLIPYNCMLTYDYHRQLLKNDCKGSSKNINRIIIRHLEMDKITALDNPQAVDKLLDKLYIYIYIYSNTLKMVGWLVGWFLWHINLCRLFNAKSILIQIVSSISKILFSMRTQFICQKHFYFKLFSLFKQF